MDAKLIGVLGGGAWYLVQGRILFALYKVQDWFILLSPGELDGYPALP